MGDSVDNIPGVRGVGPKTATKLIVEYGDMDAALAGAGTMKASKLRDNLIEHAEMARLSRILVELTRDCPLPAARHTLKMMEIHAPPPHAFLDQPGFAVLSATSDVDIGGAGSRE